MTASYYEVAICKCYGYNAINYFSHTYFSIMLLFSALHSVVQDELIAAGFCFYVDVLISKSYELSSMLLYMLLLLLLLFRCCYNIFCLEIRSVLTVRSCKCEYVSILE